MASASCAAGATNCRSSGSLVSSPRLLVFSDGIGDSASVFVSRRSVVLPPCSCQDVALAGSAAVGATVAATRQSPPRAAVRFVRCAMASGISLFDVLHAECTTTRYKIDCEKRFVVRHPVCLVSDSPEHEGPQQLQSADGLPKLHFSASSGCSLLFVLTLQATALPAPRLESPRRVVSGAGALLGTVPVCS